MESWCRQSFGLFGFGFAALLLAGCARPASGADRPGEFELRVEPAATYAVVGRFHLLAAEPTGVARDVDFDTETATVRVPLAPGAYVLTLQPGARIVCPGDDDLATADPAPGERLVSTWPQRISIEPGEVTMARINFGAPPAPQGVEALPDGPALLDPCTSAAPDAAVEQALLSH